MSANYTPSKIACQFVARQCAGDCWRAVRSPGQGQGRYGFSPHETACLVLPMWSRADGPEPEPGLWMVSLGQWRNGWYWTVDVYTQDFGPVARQLTSGPCVSRDAALAKLVRALNGTPSWETVAYAPSVE